jgi:hypothetical protein
VLSSCGFFPLRAVGPYCELGCPNRGLTQGKYARGYARGRPSLRRRGRRESSRCRTLAIAPQIRLGARVPGGEYSLSLTNVHTPFCSVRHGEISLRVSPSPESAHTSSEQRKSSSFLYCGLTQFLPTWGRVELSPRATEEPDQQRSFEEWTSREGNNRD